MFRKHSWTPTLLPLLVCASVLLPGCDDDADTDALRDRLREVETENRRLRQDMERPTGHSQRPDEQVEEPSPPTPDYGVAIPPDFKVDNPLWNRTKARLAILSPAEKKCLFVFTLAKCNENNELLEEDQLKIATFQRILLADLALIADWPHMAQNCHAEANAYTAIVRGEAAENGIRQKILLDLDRLMADRVRMAAREVSEAELDATYQKHQSLFDQTAIDAVSMAKIMVWGRKPK